MSGFKSNRKQNATGLKNKLLTDTDMNRNPDMKWLTYKDAANYTGWTVEYLRNLVSAGEIPVYGRLRVRRFRQDMLDMFLTNPDAAMRKFHLERNSHGS